jgi:molybdopterin converting factor subunit 1
VAGLIVRVKLFASYKEKAGMSDLEISLTDDATVSDAARELIRLHPAISGDSSRLMIAVNEEYQEHDYPLNENDEVAFIPPVSGG